MIHLVVYFIYIRKLDQNIISIKSEKFAQLS